MCGEVQLGVGSGHAGDNSVQSSGCLRNTVVEDPLSSRHHLK